MLSIVPCWVCRLAIANSRTSTEVTRGPEAADIPDQSESAPVNIRPRLDAPALDSAGAAIRKEILLGPAAAVHAGASRASRTVHWRRLRLGRDIRRLQDLGVTSVDVRLFGYARRRPRGHDRQHASLPRRPYCRGSPEARSVLPVLVQVTFPLAAANFMNQLRVCDGDCRPLCSAVELGLSASEWAVLAACLFAAYAAVQLPLVVALDALALDACSRADVARGDRLAMLPLSPGFAGLAAAADRPGIGISAGLMR